MRFLTNGLLSAVPPNTHDINNVDHDGQVNERTLNRLVDRGANGSMFDGLRTDDGERRNVELETLKDRDHSMTEMEALEAELKPLMEETQAETFRRLATSSIINRGPSNGSLVGVLTMALQAMICALSLEKPQKHRACLVAEIITIPSRMVGE